jgi:hypothetical protein
MTWYGMVCVFTGVFLAECSRGLLLLRGEFRGPQHTYTHTYTHTKICGCMDRLTPYVEWQTHCGHALARSSKDCRTINDVFILYSKGTMLYVLLLLNECVCVCVCVCKMLPPRCSVLTPLLKIFKMKTDYVIHYTLYFIVGEGVPRHCMDVERSGVPELWGNHRDTSLVCKTST